MARGERLDEAQTMNDSANPAMEPDHWDIGVAALSVDESFGTKLLPFVLSVTAGSVDVIGFLGLGGLFTAHITGNIVVLAAKLVAGEQAPVSYLISVPVFMAVLALTRLLAAGLERLKIASLVPLLLFQFLLLAAFFALCRSAGPRLDPNTAIMILAGMLGVSAMAVQNGLVRISLRGAPATAVMTTNITLFTIDVGQVLLGASSTAKARERARNTWPAIVGFLLGCALGAAFEAAFGLRSLVVPAGFALLALALGLTGTLHHAGATQALERGDQHDRHQT
jgi:uncharacterized membrane protein YoaK (UPF0700 family)